MSEETSELDHAPLSPEPEPSSSLPARKITRRGFLGIAASAAAAAALAACQQAAPPAPTSAPAPKPAATTGGAAPAPTAAAAAAPSTASTQPIKIGVLEVRSGVAAAVGQDGHRGTQWWADRVNKAGGIEGRQVQLIWEEESTPKDTIDRFRKLVLQDKVDVVLGGISTGVGDALGPVVEEMGMPTLFWDATTQNDVKEAIPSPKWVFRSADNEAEATGAAILTAKYFKDVKTIAGIGNDYSYGHDNWQDFQAVLNRFYELKLIPNKPEFVLALFPKLGETEFSSHIAAIQKAKPDLLMCSFWSGDSPIFFKQAAAVDLFKNMKGTFTTAGGTADALKKDIVPEGILVGYNSFYFEDPELPQLGKDFVKYYHETYKGYPSYEADHAYFVGAAYQAAVEKALKAGGGWPSKEAVVKNLEGIEVDSLSGKRGYTKGSDHRMLGTWVQGLTTHKNSFDFVTIDPLTRMPLTKIQKPTAGTDLYSWINGWKIGPDGLPEG